MPIPSMMCSMCSLGDMGRLAAVSTGADRMVVLGVKHADMVSTGADRMVVLRVKHVDKVLFPRYDTLLMALYMNTILN